MTDLHDSFYDLRNSMSRTLGSLSAFLDWPRRAHDSINYSLHSIKYAQGST